MAELSNSNRPRDRATAPMIPILDPPRREIIGYTFAEYLLQDLSRLRRSEQVPSAAWNALIRLTQDRDHLLRLADQANRRLLYSDAESVYRKLLSIDKTDAYAAYQLANILERQDRNDEAIVTLGALSAPSGSPAGTLLVDLLAKQGRSQDLRAHAAAGDWHAAELLIDGLIEQDRVDDAISILQPLAVSAESPARTLLVELLADEGRTEELRRYANAGNLQAARYLVGLLGDDDGTDDVVQILQRMAEAGDEEAGERLANLLARHGRTSELRARADSGDVYASIWLATLLCERDCSSDAIKVLQNVADTGAPFADRRLVDLMVEHHRTSDLQARADARDGYAAEQLATLLVNEGRTNEAIVHLQRLAEHGVVYAAMRLANLLSQVGRNDLVVDVLRRAADAGNRFAAEQLVDLLADQGREDELRLRADAGDTQAAKRLVMLMVKNGRVDDLQARAASGDRYAVLELAQLLDDRGRTDEAVDVLRAGANEDDSDRVRLRLIDLLARRARTDELLALSNAGDRQAAIRLAEFLNEKGRTDDAIAVLRRADDGSRDAGRRLVDFLFRHGRINELRERADNGDRDAAQRLADLLRFQGRTDELQVRADGGDRYAARRLTDLLANVVGRAEERVEMLRVRADGGDGEAAEQLIDLLTGQDREDDLWDEVNAGTAGASEGLLRLIERRDPRRAGRIRCFGLKPGEPI